MEDFNQEFNEKLIYFIRNTGEIQIFSHHYCLDFQSNIVFRLENNYITPVCFGRFDSGLWHFRGLKVMISHKDQLVAAFKVLYYAYKYEIIKQKAKRK